MNRVDEFLAKLSQTAPKAKEDFKSKNRSLEKIYLNFPGNFGRYQVLPMDSVVTDFPFATLFGTREINIPRKNLAPDGTENIYNAWIKILPKNAYVMKDMTGRQVSSLTANDEQLLNQAYMIFDQLYEELDVKNNRNDPAIIGLARKRNYTLFHGMCLNKWDSDSRTPVRQNFCGLFVCTAKGFTNAIEDNIQEKTLMNNGDASWVTSIYNRQLTGRDGFLMFSISTNKNQAGYTVTATHEIGRAKNLEGISISDEDAELMIDPVHSFLGWQANKDDNNAPGQKRLFNAALIQEAITFMSQQLAAIRMAKQTGMTLGDAINNTNAEALKNQVPTNSQGQLTNDPLLANMSKPAVGDFNQQTVSNPEAVVNGNTSPFQTPPAAHIDPMTNAPMGNPGFGGNSGFGSNPTPSTTNNVSFQKPAFANFGGSSNDDLPF